MNLLYIKIYFVMSTKICNRC